MLRAGTRDLLARAAEAAAFLARHADLKTADGRRRVVRHCYMLQREIVAGIGAVAVCGARIRFSSALLPAYARRSKSMEALIPILYLKGISTGDFEEALAALLSAEASGLSASSIVRLKEGWKDDLGRWKARDLSARRYVYVWADGIALQARLEEERQAILVLIGATPEWEKELIDFTDGVRESAEDWRSLLLDLKRRGLTPRARIGDRRRRTGVLEGARRDLAENERLTA